jgi:hypothetical protein
MIQGFETRTTLALRSRLESLELFTTEARSVQTLA